MMDNNFLIRWNASRMFCLIVLSTGMFRGDIVADEIYVAGSGNTSIDFAINHLTSLGHNVTNGAGLVDYTGYDQVWDLRYDEFLTSGDRASLESYMAQGGRLYLSGESSAVDFVRNDQINLFLSQIGAGTNSYVGDTSGPVNQTFTTAGDLLRAPNEINGLFTLFARTVSPTGGFLVTEVASGSEGSLVGWDFGDISQYQESRLLVGYDIEMFNSGIAWTENVHHFLSSNSIPEPASAMVFCVAAGTVLLRRRR